MKKNIFIESNEIIKLIALKQEGEYWDFKKEWHQDNAVLLHDIICMANNLVDRDAYIIIGVDEENNHNVCDITTDPNRKTTQNLVDFLREKRFSGGIRPKVYVQSMILDAMTVDILVVLNNFNTPFFLTESYHGVFANNIYTRVMDTNTPKNQSADIGHVEYLWKKRFGLTSTPLERVQLLLREPENWLSSPEETSMIEFYKFAPEYTIEHIQADRDGYEFYLFGQADSRPRWYDINIKYHQTLIASIGGVGLDGARFFTASPQSNTICFGHRFDLDNGVSYKYFNKDTLEYATYEYYLMKIRARHEAQIANRKYMDCILVFESELEKVQFEIYVREKQDRFTGILVDSYLPYIPDIKGYRMEAFKKEYSDSIVLQQLLHEFRSRI